MKKRKLDWEKAERHLREMYIKIGWAGTLGLSAVIIPLRNRYLGGERTQKLYKEIMKLE